MFLDSANTSDMDGDGLETLLNERESSAEGGDSDDRLEMRDGKVFPLWAIM